MSNEREKAADLRLIAELREGARRARYAAWQISDKQAARGLLRDAEELESRADALEAGLSSSPASESQSTRVGGPASESQSTRVGGATQWKK